MRFTKKKKEISNIDLSDWNKLRGTFALYIMARARSERERLIIVQYNVVRLAHLFTYRKII